MIYSYPVSFCVISVSTKREEAVCPKKMMKETLLENKILGHSIDVECKAWSDQ